MAATKTLTVAAYRELIDFLAQSLSDLRSARGPVERVRGAYRVRHRAAVLTAAVCDRAGAEDRGRAERQLDASARYLIETGLAEICNKLGEEREWPARFGA